MPGITISTNVGQNNLMYGDVQGPMIALLEQIYNNYDKPEFTIWQKIFKDFDLQNKEASIASMGGLGLFEDVGERGEYPNDSFKDGFTKLISALEWKDQFSISQTMMEDKLDFVMKDGAKKLIDSYYRTKNHFFWGLMAAALLGKDYITGRGNTVSIKTMDGVNLFSAAHKMAHAKGALANAFTDAFSASALGKVATRMQNMKDDNGEIIGLVPNTIIIPNIETAKADVFGVLGAHNDPNTAAGNRYNYQFGQWDVITVPWLADLAKGDSYPWIVMDSHYNEECYGALDVERVALNIKSDIAPNDDNIWKGRCRFSGAFVDFRAFAAGGLEYGAPA